MRICGFNPQQCCKVSALPDILTAISDNINLAIKETTNLSDAMNNMATGQPIHCAFEIWPSPDSRIWSSFDIRPISDWAFSMMVAELDRRDADAAYKILPTNQGVPQ